jgi:hypothetical protein
MLQGVLHVSAHMVVQNRCDAILRAFFYSGRGFFVILLELFFIHYCFSIW